MGSNKLTDLTNGPKVALGIYQVSNNPLISLKGLPEQGVHHFYCGYTSDLPLLRLVQVNGASLNHPEDAHVPVMRIIKKYVGKGKSHMLNLALELKQAGYAGNAAW